MQTFIHECKDDCSVWRWWAVLGDEGSILHYIHPPGQFAARGWIFINWVLISSCFSPVANFARCYERSVTERTLIQNCSNKYWINTLCTTYRKLCCLQPKDCRQHKRIKHDINKNNNLSYTKDYGAKELKIS